MPDSPLPRGMRVVIDLRPLQEPDRAPATAAYLGHLLRAFAAEPLEGESFVALLQAGLADPTDSIPGLPVVARRRLPPTRALRSTALTIDPFLLRGATIGTGGPADAVYHLAGASLPLGSGLPIVATLLDLAAWELPGVFQATPAARFGQRLRTRILRDAAIVVGTNAVARRAARLLHVHAEQVHVVPLAADPAFRLAGDDADALAVALERERGELGLPARYVVFFGRHDVRSDLGTLFDALGLLAERPRPDGLPAAVPWPPALVLLGASPDDRAGLAREAARRGAAEWLSYAPYLPPARLATLVAGARAAIMPAVSEAAGLSVIDAIACGTPVVASATGALPEIVGPAGIVAEPRDPARLARAIETIWLDDELHEGLRAAAIAAAARLPTWADVARRTRAVYAVAAATERESHRIALPGRGRS